jgi:hypothetical protein
MPMSFRDLVQTGRLTLQKPREGARMVMNWPLAVGELWLVLALTAVVSALLAELLVTQTPEGVDPVLAMMMSSPIWFAAIQFGGLAILTTLIFWIGRKFGGRGSFAGALALIGWLQSILVVVQVAQIVALFVLPPFALVISLISLVLFLWLLTSFIAELHGFKSLGWTFAGMIGAFFGMTVTLSVILVLVLGLGA